MTDEEVHDGEIPEDVVERLDDHDTYIRLTMFPSPDGEYAMALQFGHKDKSLHQGVMLEHDQVCVLHHHLTNYLEAVDGEDYEVTEHTVRENDRGIQ